ESLAGRIDAKAVVDAKIGEGRGCEPSGGALRPADSVLRGKIGPERVGTHIGQILAAFFAVCQQAQGVDILLPCQLVVALGSTTGQNNTERCRQATEAAACTRGRAPRFLIVSRLVST